MSLMVVTEGGKGYQGKVAQVPFDTLREEAGMGAQERP